MTERVLSEEEIKEIEIAVGHKPFIGSLIATIRAWQNDYKNLHRLTSEAQKQNTILREALEYYSLHPVAGLKARGALAKVKEV